MRIEFEKLKKSDQPTHNGKTGLGKRKQFFLRLASKTDVWHT